LKNWALAPAVAGALAMSCSIGEGSGSVRSDRIQAGRCWDGPIDLEPSFFAANPFENTVNLRIQRGEEAVGVSDGVSIVVNDVRGVRRTRLRQRLSLGLPEGVRPLGYPLVVEPTPPDASLSLYLNNSCRNQSVTLYAQGGWIQFEQLFSGDPNEDRPQDRLTAGSFHAELVDYSPPSSDDEAGTGGILDGEFRFVFQRGTPAQPFP
jgi:hypothetical protein